MFSFRLDPGCRDGRPFPYGAELAVVLLTISEAGAGAELFGRRVGVSGSVGESLLPRFSGFRCPAREPFCVRRSELGVLITGTLPRAGAGMVIPADPNSSLLF